MNLLQRIIEKIPDHIVEKIRLQMDSSVGMERRDEAVLTPMQISKARLENRRDIIDHRLDGFLKNIRTYCIQNDLGNARISFENLLTLSEIRAIVEEIISAVDDWKAVDAEKAVPTYTAGSWFLYDCFDYLSKQPEESVHFVTGVQLGNIYILDRMVTFKMDIQTMTRASGDHFSSHNALIEMDEYGHRLLAYFHIHPGKGESITQPSHIDMDYQTNLDRGGYQAIGGIFSRDGYLRFFPEDKRFEVEIYGKGVEKIEDRLFRLIKAETR